MRQWRIRLDGLAETERPRFLAGFLERFFDTLDRQFPSSSGYQSEGYWHSLSAVESGLLQIASWRNTRGRLRGLEVVILAEDEALKSLKISIDGYCPIFDGTLNGVEERIERIDKVGGHGVWDFFLVSFVILFAVPLFLLLLGRAIGKLALRSEMRAASQLLEAIWAEMQGRSSATVTLSRLIKRPQFYSIVFVLLCATTALCFWSASSGNSGDSLTIVLYFIGIIVGLFSLVMLIALTLTILGFRGDT